MELASIILSTIALVASLACLVIMLAKNFFSSHVIQTQMVDPFKELFPSEIGKQKLDPYKDIDTMLSQEEIDELKGKKTKFVP